MFIIERLAGISVYAFLLILFEMIILFTKSKLSITLLIYILCLSIIGYLYVPYETSDLFRIRDIINYYSTLPWNEFFIQEVELSSTPLSNIIYWFFGNINFVNGISIFSAIICYSIIFYMINDLVKLHNLSRFDSALLVLSVMSSGLFMPIIGGIRMMISICFIILGLYLICKSKKYLPFVLILLLLGILIHTISVLIIFLSLLAFLLSKYVRKKDKVFVFVLFLILGLIFLLKNSFLIDSYMDKIDYYLDESSYFDTWESIICFYSLILFIALIFLSGKTKRDSFYYLSILTLISSIILVRSFSLFHRLIVETCSITILPVLATTLSKSKYRQSDKIRITLLFAYLVLLLINATRGSLSALKFS